MKNILLFIFLIVSAYPSQKEELYNFIIQTQDSTEIENDILEYQNKRVKAFIFSGLFSGAGHFYLKDWKKGVIYSSVEFIEWEYKNDSLKESEDYTKIYKEYADENWSFTNWVKNYYSFNSIDNPMYSAFINISYNEDGSESYTYVNPWDQSHGIKFYENDTPNILFNTSNESEFSVIYQTWCGEEFVNGCSEDVDNLLNNITIVNDHHHYEGIGKYNVYFAGWEDSDTDSSWVDTLSNNYRVAYSPMKDYYENNLRNNAKSNHDKAENALTTIFLTHAISMLDILINYNTENKISLQSNFDFMNRYKNGRIDISIWW